MRGFLALLVLVATVSGCTHGKFTVFEPLQCVPYARDVSGIEIYGDAYTWWDKAPKEYSRGHKPRQGSVIVLSKTERLPYGHVAVVERVVSNREIQVTHVNFGQDYNSRRVVYHDMTAIDTSAKNDWSRVHFVMPNGGTSRIYPVSGFVYNTPH